jgi:hypothetical protein
LCVDQPSSTNRLSQDKVSLSARGCNGGRGGVCLATLELRSNNATHQPLIRALVLLKQYLPSRVRTYPVEEDVPLEGVIRDAWREAVVETDAQGRQLD